VSVNRTDSGSNTVAGTSVIDVSYSSSITIFVDN
jgi:hypothetical protein